MGTPGDRLRAALHNVFRVIFDVERTRGKLHEWYSTVADPAQVRAAQTLAAVLRKIEFLNSTALRTAALSGGLSSLDASDLTALGNRLAGGVGTTPDGARNHFRARGALKRRLRRLVMNATTLSTLLAMDHFMETRLQSVRPSWLASYRRVRTRIRRALAWP
jgi:hypothetical protein